MAEVNKSIRNLRNVRNLVLNITLFKYIHNILTNRAINLGVRHWHLLINWSTGGATKISTNLLKAMEMKRNG